MINDDINDDITEFQKDIINVLNNYKPTIKLPYITMTGLTLFAEIARQTLPEKEFKLFMKRVTDTTCEFVDSQLKDD
jgi:hypothetical protein